MVGVVGQEIISGSLEKKHEWRATVITLFPDMFPGSLGNSLAGKALDGGLWKLDTVDIRRYSSGNNLNVDDMPFGGGPGMIMRADVVDAALMSIQNIKERPTIFLTPRGKPLGQERVKELAVGKGVILVCGRYEGIDDRVIKDWQIEEISLGDFVLSGGEPAALAVIDACVRLLPGVVGNEQATWEESFEDGLLEYPQYTRPREWKGLKVPEVLISGHHDKIRAWRKTQAEKITAERRPDLWKKYSNRLSLRLSKH
ncbi:MAG: tRNA (guanosine(37)-N1)-methyltransferase TrmD [Pseudomonadota bacterium]|nr:tRNA (guanosine(37)-N1)-methyltransferase TrmD [Pseudomonadota bacterium]